jgi:hypothetical protein
MDEDQNIIKKQPEDSQYNMKKSGKQNFCY